MAGNLESSVRQQSVNCVENGKRAENTRQAVLKTPGKPIKHYHKDGGKKHG
jgi:hypothetical protein